ncbi:hypothetical protein, partial [Erwinia amylovora]|uniref:hypothetical protein n=1 Tax=Erwinia amylovora TaxID=552 RepID=UPI0020BEFC04
ELLLEEQQQHAEQINQATQASARAVALASAGHGQGRWLEGAIAGVIVGFIAYFVTREWADRSHGMSLFASIIIGVAVMLVIASFEKRPEP